MNENKPELNSRLLEILSYFSEITSISNLDKLIDTVVKKTPYLLYAAGCSIYLIPELVKGYDSILLDREGKAINAEAINAEFIVLAETSRSGNENLVGKAFYPKGEGLSGWVFLHGQPLRLNDMRDQERLYDIAIDLHWTDRYGGSHDYYDGQEDQMPILIVPLIADQQTIGILKIPARGDKSLFTEEDEQIATVIAQVIASLIEKSSIVQQQTQYISQLVEISAEEDWKIIAKSVTESLSGILKSDCRLYLRNQDSSLVQRVFANGKPVDRETALVFHRGEGLVGWVFNTGKPLLISDARRYIGKCYLDDDLLEEISNSTEINDEDRWLSCKFDSSYDVYDHALPFLVVPVKASDGSIYGVLCASCINNGHPRRTNSFDRTELQLAQSFASTIAVAKENNRERQLGDLLVNLSLSWDVDHLFSLVVEKIPDLVSGSGCSIYTLKQDSEKSILSLVKSTRRDLLDERGNLIDLTYRLNEGKTGFCGFSEATLIVNHYGLGRVAHQNIDEEMKQIATKHPEDYVEYLKDCQGQEVGIIQLRRGAETKISERRFRGFAKRLKLDETGLLSEKLLELGATREHSSWSFVAVPILYGSNKMYGVISMGRPVPCNPFSHEDITLFESIAHQLANVMFSFEVLEERKCLLMTLAHEINTPLTGILADSQNLNTELPVGSELEEMSKHLIGQVQRLHLLTETIMAVISGETSSREFSSHSIYRPLMEAIELFKSEAQELGFDIRGPWHRGPGKPFPVIEMSLFDLQIAFKNLVHNAVKYSFSSPKSIDESRYISILGRWVDEDHYSVTIENYGVGIAQEEIDRRLIFKPYYRGKYASDRRRTGAGFGLAHARQIIEDLHHGKIDVVSRPLPGDAHPHLIEFTVILPIAQPRTSDDRSHPIQRIIDLSTKDS